MAVSASAQTTDKTVEKIRAYYNDISEKARLCETEDDQGEFGDLVMNELVINSRGHQWRAVGQYRQSHKFFYKGGNSERHLYPDQLVLVVSEQKVSDRRYREEWLFSDTGVLMFYYKKSEGDAAGPAERRVYFTSIKAVRIVEDAKQRDRLTAADLKVANQIATQGRRVNDLFKQSIKL